MSKHLATLSNPVATQTFRRPAGLLGHLALGALVAGLLVAAPMSAPAAWAAELTHVSIASTGATRSLTLSVNKSLILDLPADAQEVIISQPGVANAVLRTKRRAILQGVAAGDTNIFFLDAAGRNIAVIDIRVDIGNDLEAVLARALPGSNVRVEAMTTGSTTHFVLTGTVQTAKDKAVAEQLAADISGSTGQIGSLIEVAGPTQVMLKVTVAEVNRQVAKALGIRLGGSYSAGGMTTDILNIPATGGMSNIFPTNNRINASISAGPVSLNASIQALQQQRAIRTLAEPTLTAMSGQPADFNAGGQFAVPTAVDQNGGVSYSYKDFGVKLSFTPTIESSGSIGLTVDTSVSELSAEGSITVGQTTLPGIKNRQAKTSVELGVGQTLAIGGLIQDSIRTEVDRLPGLGDIPILGALFRSRDYLHAQTEMVVLVTPYYAQAQIEPPVLPTEKMAVANDAEAIFLGHIETMYGVGPAGTRGSYDGHVGFLLD